MGLVKVEYSWSRTYRLKLQNLIQLVFLAGVKESFASAFVCILCLSLFTQTLTMAEENKQLTAVVQGNSLFTRNLYQILAKEKQKNIFFSPISIHAVLAMASQGSGGKTQKAFTDALQVPSISTLAQGYQDAMTKLNSVQDVTLHMANKIYLKESYSLKDAFRKTVSDNFFSEVQSINFEENAAAAKTINTWVEDKTNNKIQDLIKPDDVDKTTRLVLVNAIYFKGKWAEPFKPSETQTEKFYLNDNDTIDVSMMHIKKKFFYKNDESLDAKVLELPYTNKDLSMIVILPNKRNGIDELEAKLANYDLSNITADMYKPEVIVALPKFKIEATIQLNDPLTELGLGEIFSDSADFSGMLNSPEELKVSKVIQKAFIEVNEEGAEAAAATGLKVIMKRSLDISPIEEFKCDRPFFVIFIFRHQPISNVLFKGKIFHPGLAELVKTHDEL
ncbi:unnamed protein product [Phyllotreta striolata]|uniref:Serpin domain-containing protein n=1 Tax=Phyllotreta striolata TaxID=444603 RepID=A0A9N9TFC5_PHYSR|nr:unnamed protein product [Phyllotreta striolata]